MSKMKVAVVTAATNTIPRFRIDMIDEFVHRGCDVLVLGNDQESDWDVYFKEHDVRYRSYSVSRNGINPFDDIGTLRELEIIFEEETPDRVFTYQAKPNIYGSIAAHRAGIKAVYVMMGGLGSVFHAPDLKSKLLRSVVLREYRVALKHAAGVFFQNEEDAKTFECLGIIDRNKVHMVRGSGVSLDRFPERPLPPQPVISICWKTCAR
ncbi:glycosyltransferase [Collinsella tanakaei]|uniref:glycosyltransferase n=1 Tax=Collinsella tanakaei TaxID=626935 RepID=UPI0025A43202|nr:glycosyltransferase [Collinsella tanakaei]MDM8246380.1 glycosyltransferase [Collinsella tanakaei]